MGKVAPMRTFMSKPEPKAAGEAKASTAMASAGRPGRLWWEMATAPIQRQCAACSEPGGKPPQRPGRIDSLVHQGVSTPGEPLDDRVQAEFADRAGHDLSDVRIHRTSAAAASAHAVAARAYTVGHDVVFGAGEFAPETSQGQRLLAHELAHVVQQREAKPMPVAQGVPLTVSTPGDRAEREADRVADALAGRASVPAITERPTAALARAPFDVNAIAGATDRMGAVPAPLPIPLQLSLLFIVRGGHSSGELTKAADYPKSFTVPTDKSKPVPSAKRPKADAVPPRSNIHVEAHFFPSMWPTANRALVLGGFHGDEQPGWQVTDALVTELSQPGANAELAFHTVVVPRVNAAAISDELAGGRLWRSRCNRQLVDLNRNFPTGDTPRDTDCPNTVGAPVQPEVQGVLDVVAGFRPDRIVSTHAISDPKRAGIFADPNLSRPAAELARGMASTVVNKSDRPANKLGPDPRDFNPVYPGDKPGKVSAGTSLGAWAPTAVPGKDIPVITMEAPGFTPLGSGPGSAARTVASFLRPVRAFLGAPASLATAADRDILADIDAFTAADRIAFLTGQLPRIDDIFRRIRLRMETAVATLNAMKPPKPIVITSWLRLFSEDVPKASAQAQLVFDKFFLTGDKAKGWDTLPDKFFKGGHRAAGVDRASWLKAPSKERLAIIVEFSSLPGTSRHHWGTEVDLNSIEVADWQPGHRFYELGEWLRANAPSAGLVQAYTPGHSGGYHEEPWHYSYAPISVGLRERYNKQVNLTNDVIDKIVSEFDRRAKAAGETMPADFTSALKAVNISDLVNNVGPGL
jgi:Domain of unknown function (DUF4157)/D-alanyl-D-alanine carboxypeptidase